MIVWTWMVLNDVIRLPNTLSFELNDFVDQRLDNSDAEVIILRSIIMINYDQIFMYRN
jgi:hypothetical protein